MEINSNAGTVPQLYAMKKASEVQERAIMKVLESAQALSAPTQNGSELTGLGQKLDIRA